MNRLAAFLALLATGIPAYAAEPTRALLAQCHLESFGDAGRHFLKENANTADKDFAYRNWMMLCMQSKGFVYDLTACGVDKTTGKPIVSVLSDPCFKKMGSDN